MEEKNTIHQKQVIDNTLFKSLGQMLLEMIALSGEYPTENLPRLLDSPTYARRIVAKLASRQLIKTVYKNSARGYRLTIQGKRLLMAENPDRFEGILMGVGDTNKLRSDLSRRLRLHSLAQVYTMMLHAGVQIFQDCKPSAFTPSQSPSEISANNLPRITSPCFYSSREQKGDNGKSNSIQGSRATGTLLTPTCAYAVYNTGNSHVGWGEKVEKRYAAEVNFNLHRMSRHNQYDGGNACGILIGENMESLEQYWTAKKKTGAGLSFLAKAYEPFYFITNDSYGDMQLKLLCDAGRIKLLHDIFCATWKLKPRDANKIPVEHDALCKDGNPVLFCCLLDMPRLFRFFNGLTRHGYVGQVLVFEFQATVIKRYLGERATYMGVSFEHVKKHFFRKGE